MLDIDTGLGAHGANGLLFELKIGTVIGAGSTLQRYEVATLPLVIAKHLVKTRIARVFPEPPFKVLQTETMKSKLDHLPI